MLLWQQSSELLHPYTSMNGHVFTRVAIGTNKSLLGNNDQVFTYRFHLPSSTPHMVLLLLHRLCVCKDVTNLLAKIMSITPEEIISSDIYVHT